MQEIDGMLKTMPLYLRFDLASRIYKYVSPSRAVYYHLAFILNDRYFIDRLLSLQGCV